MEIRRWQMYVVINIVIVTHLSAKPVSLNELIAAESKQNQDKSQHTKSTGAKPVSLNKLIAAESKQKHKKSQDTKPSSAASTATPFSAKESYPAESRQKFEKTRFRKIPAKKPRRQSFSLKDLFAGTHTKRRIESLLPKTSGAGLFAHRRNLLPTLSRKPFESTEDILSLARAITPLKFRKKFEIKSPLKPKKIKYSFTQRHKRRNQSTKREANENEVFGHKYLPLIKRIGLLVDDILSPESGESVEQVKPSRNRRKPRRNPKLSNAKDRLRDLESSESKPQKTTIVASTTIIPEITTDAEDTTSETPDPTAYTTPSGDINTLRPDTDLPLPPARNTSSDRRDYHGVGEGSGSPFYGDIERHIPRNNRGDEYNSRGGRNETNSPTYEENSGGSARIGTRSNGPGSGTNAQHPDVAEETKISSYRDGFVRGSDTAKNVFKVGEEEALQVPRNIRRLPGTVPDHKVFIIDAESVPTQKSREESVFNVANNHTSAERGPQWDGTAATENQRIRQVIEGVIPIHELISPNFLKQHSQNNQLVTIFDGYSVARDINGRNKLTEKSIRISPN